MISVKSELISIADRLFSELIRRRGYCEKCGRTSNNYDCAHIIGRRSIALRFDPKNALCLDRECHQEVHAHPAEFESWFKNKYPTTWTYLQFQKNIVQKNTITHLYEVICNLRGKLGYARIKLSDIMEQLSDETST